ncbi:MAG: hypothetical protein IKN72_10665 [Clostridia bacterium]|nr:hypothetical protein [Clostridia bacterium]
MKKALSVLLSVLMVALTLSCLSVCFTASAAGYNVGDTFTFGSYPQTKVINTQTISALNLKAKNATWSSLAFYCGNSLFTDQVGEDPDSKYCDVTYNGVKYRGVKFSSYRPWKTDGENSTETPPYSTYYQYTNGYRINTTYWFKYEPLKWTVLDPVTGLAVCQSVIDARPFNNFCTRSEQDKDYYNHTAIYTDYASDYAHSSLRTWLNNTFLGTAFTAVEQGKIPATALQNRCVYAFTATHEHPELDSDDTNDKIFALSFDEVINAAYGFDPQSGHDDPLRKRAATDYAKCLGVQVDNSGKSAWRLRTPGQNTRDTCVVNASGQSAKVGPTYANVNAIGLCPALRCSDVTPASVNVVHVTLETNGQGIAYGGGTFTKGTLVTVQANPTLFSEFTGWYEDGVKVSNNLTYSFTVTKDTTLSAGFRIVKAKLTLTTEGKGSVIGGGVYQITTPVQITATPSSGWHFVGWYNGETLVSANASYQYPLFTDTTLTAKFEKDAAPEQPEPQQSVCPWCGGAHEGFFQKIVGWFHSIFAAIFGARY